MEFKLKPMQLPEKIEFNYDELKSEIQEKTKIYNALFYSDKEIKLAKSDRANLNRLKKTLNSERIYLEKQYLIPFNEFKSQINNLISIIDEPIKAIDEQIKQYEINKKEEKKEKIKKLFNELNSFEWLKLNQVYDIRWENASVSMKKVEEALNIILEHIKMDIETLDSLPAFAFEAKQFYYSSLNLHEAVNLAKKHTEIEKKKLEEEKRRLEEEEKRKTLENDNINLPFVVPDGEGNLKLQENNPDKLSNTQIKLDLNKMETMENIKPVKEIPREWVKFEAYLSYEDALKLNKFFKENNIKFRKCN